MRGPPHVKLTVHVVELASQTVWSTLAILEDLSAETSKEVCVCVCVCVYSYVLRILGTPRICPNKQYKCGGSRVH